MADSATSIGPQHSAGKSIVLVALLSIEILIVHLRLGHWYLKMLQVPNSR